MSSEPQPVLTLKDRLEFYYINRADCSAAIQGEKVPLALGMQVTQACIIRGIRYYPGFASELYGALPVFTRALHARSIMSNVIPNFTSSDEIPYCVWYPEVANISTYRQLASKYPEMRYQVGRACAVAGYVDLYRSLGLLPEVSIAEEALANDANPGARTIFEDIMAAPVKYAVMNDYTRTINLQSPIVAAHLNADTAVRSTLDEKHFFEGNDSYSTSDEYEYRPLEQKNAYFNITEDFCVTDESLVLDTHSESTMKRPASDVKMSLLHNPLPPELPSINKDLLILRAAYSGNIDRYARLRRPVLIRDEISCIIRGIYHDTMFAKWWSRELDLLNSTLPIHIIRHIKAAINARFIMNNDLSRITDNTPNWELPYLIHYPNFATVDTYFNLLKLKPSMKLQIARAFMVMNEQEHWKALNPEPDVFLFAEACDHPNRYYFEDFLRRDPDIRAKMRDVSDYEAGKCVSFLDVFRTKRRRRGRELVEEKLVGDGVDFETAQMGGIYNGLKADFEELERYTIGLEMQR